MTRKGKLTLAIDGPAAAGKTVVGTKMAKRLGYRFLDTGMMYRAATFAAIEARIDLSNLQEIENNAEKTEIGVTSGQKGETRILLKGKDVTEKLRSHEVDKNVSMVSAIPKVRTVMVRNQRIAAETSGIIMVGRDIGTVVLPDSDIKFFLTASLETRANRRFKEMQGSSVTRAPYNDVINAMRRRDEIDSSREMSPLKAADDSIVVKTDKMTINEVVSCLLKFTDRFLT